MQIQLTGHHIDITESLRQYVLTKFERLERHFGRAHDAHVVLTVEKQSQKAEATVHINKGNVFADAVNADMYAAIDAMVDKLDRQMIKHKEKHTDYRTNVIPPQE